MSKKILNILGVLLVSNIYSQNNSFVRYIKWNESTLSSNGYLKLDFSGAYFPDSSNIFPYYKEQFELPFNCDLVLSDIVFEKLDSNIANKIYHSSNLPDTFIFKKFMGQSRKKYVINFTLLPLCKSKTSNTVFRIKSFSLNIPSNSIKKTLKVAKSISQHSVLSSGKWYKIKLNEDGVYKITYSQLKSMGFENPGNIRIYGNGGGMSPLKVNGKRPDDLRENAILYNDAGGYILFYGQGPNVWHYNSSQKHFFHSQHKFSAYSYYFLTDNLGKGEQVVDSNEPSVTNIDVRYFDDYDYHETDEINLLGSGAEWYGDEIDVYSQISFSYNFPNIVDSSTAFFYYDIIGRSSTSASYFMFGLYDKNFVSSYIGNINPLDVDYDYAKEAAGSFTFTATEDNIPVSVEYISSGDNNAIGYIDYFGFNVRRNLIFVGDQMQFRDLNSVGPGNVAKYMVSGVSNNMAVWDITDVCLPRNMANTISSSTLSFSASADSLRQFIIFNTNSGLLSPIVEGDDVGLIENQDIHGATNADLIIVAPNDTGILRQAKLLADFRTSNDGYKVFLTTTDKIYNEFSSGKRDISAIRDMVKMFYDRSTSESNMPKYLLLFGDGTYDNKTINPNNNNLVPTYQSANSLVKISSYVADDFYGWLDDADTISDELNLLDIGVGRFPISNADEAAAMVAKVINYASPSTMADWRNVLCYIADDGDGNLHIGQGDNLANRVSSQHPSFIIQKIYLDAYNYVTTSVGQTAPDVNTDINNRVNKGALIINYNGHGGETQLSHLSVVTESSVEGWKNFDRLPLFITATCEFSRFDDVTIITPGKQFEEKKIAGTEVLLNPQGGGVALFGATRVVDAGPNANLNIAFFDTMFSKDKNGNFMRIGDVYRIAKNSLPGDINRLSFTLLGDPSTLLAFPKENGIITDSINGKPISALNDTLCDTLKALSFVRISGHVEDINRNLQNEFNGKIFPTVFDKEEICSTLGNDNNIPYKFTTSENLIFKGISSVKSGKFSFDFMIPKDIRYNFSNGKIVYYADDSINDMAGYTKSFIIGGINSKASLDTAGPIMTLYMNDTNFISRGLGLPMPTHNYL